mgnify:FL=1
MSCHAPVSPGGDVEAAAPHFANVRYRLRPDWIPGWVKDPQKIMPGTRMPQLWLPENPEDPKSKIFAIPGYFGDDPEKQMLKVRDYLFAISEKAELPSPRNEKKKKEETSLGAGAE